MRLRRRFSLARLSVLGVLRYKNPVINRPSYKEICRHSKLTVIEVPNSHGAEFSPKQNLIAVASVLETRDYFHWVAAIIKQARTCSLRMDTDALEVAINTYVCTTKWTCMCSEWQRNLIQRRDDR